MSAFPRESFRYFYLTWVSVRPSKPTNGQANKQTPLLGIRSGPRSSPNSNGCFASSMESASSMRRWDPGKSRDRKSVPWICSHLRGSRFGFVSEWNPQNLPKKSALFYETSFVGGFMRKPTGQSLSLFGLCLKGKPKETLKMVGFLFGFLVETLE